MSGSEEEDKNYQPMNYSEADGQVDYGEEEDDEEGTPFPDNYFKKVNQQK